MILQRCPRLTEAAKVGEFAAELSSAASRRAESDFLLLSLQKELVAELDTPWAASVKKWRWGLARALFVCVLAISSKACGFRVLSSSLEYYVVFFCSGLLFFRPSCTPWLLSYTMLNTNLKYKKSSPRSLVPCACPARQKALAVEKYRSTNPTANAVVYTYMTNCCLRQGMWEVAYDGKLAAASSLARSHLVSLPIDKAQRAASASSVQFVLLPCLDLFAFHVAQVGEFLCCFRGFSSVLMYSAVCLCVGRSPQPMLDICKSLYLMVRRRDRGAALRRPANYGTPQQSMH